LKKALCGALVCLMVLAEITAYVPPAKSEDVAVLAMDEVLYTCGEGQQFNVTVWVFCVNDLYAWQIEIHYDRFVLNCVNAFYPDENVFADKPTWSVSPVIDNENGYVMFCNTILGNVESFNGSGKLCTLTFTAVSNNSCFLLFSRSETFLLNSALDVTPTRIEDASFGKALATVEFEFNPMVPDLGEPVTFDASHSIGSIILYTWNFGDGNVTATTDPIVKHAYSANGTYRVFLNVTVFDGSTFGRWKLIRVGRRDVGIVNVVPSAHRLYSGRPMGINVTLMNKGQFTSDADVSVTISAPIGSFDKTRFNQMWIKPSYIDLANCTVRERFNVTIWLNTVEPIIAWQADLRYDGNCLVCTRGGYTNGETSQFFSGLQTYLSFPSLMEWGRVMFGELAYSDRTPGQGSLGWLEFEITNTQCFGSLILEKGAGLLEGGTLMFAHDFAKIQTLRGTCQYGPKVKPLPIENQTTFDIERTKIIGLDPGQSETLTFILDTSGVKPYDNFTVLAMVSAPNDENASDDTMILEPWIQTMMLCDVNGDGKIDARDIAAFSICFGQSLGGDKWKELCDVNFDGRINVKDIALAAKYYGKKNI